MRIYVEGVGLCGPGLDGWAASRPVLAGRAPYVPAPTVVRPTSLLPTNERRRTVQTVKLALAVGAEAFAGTERDPADTAAVFTSSGADGENLHEMLRVLASPTRELSPTRFHNSVHNAPAGYWNIATHSHAPSSSICCHDASFAAGLLEAAVQTTAEARAVALIAYDVCYPEPLNSVRPIEAEFGVALILAPCSTAASFARLDIELRCATGCASGLSSGQLETLRLGTPAARSLPLLAALARGASETMTLDYLSPLEIHIALDAIGPTSAGNRGSRSLARAQG